jgi:formate hydrogenlyase subunit 3/multisubunit Na+/H+ antiporter MnhD subunit
LFGIRQWADQVSLIGVGVTVLLAGAASQIPINTATQLGPFSFKLADTLIILGRRFVLADTDRPVLVLIYLIAALWFLGAALIQAGNLFVPVGLGMVALLTAALAVDPFLYAALFIEMAALLSVPLLAVPGRPVRTGIIRFLTFQTLGVPFILFTGWMLAGVEASPADIELVVRASLVLGLGFAFLLAVFPFHTWIPILAGEVHPFTASFIFILFTTMVSLFGLSFLDRFAWLRNSDSVFLLLRYSGLLMVGVGGIWAASNAHLGRILGYAVIVEIGLILLASSTGRGGGIRLYFNLLPARILALLLWSLALAEIRRLVHSLKMEAAVNLGRRMPITAWALIFSQFALAGLPLLAGFPARFELWTRLAEDSAWLALGATVGSLGLLIAGLRTLVAFFRLGENDGLPQPEDRTLAVVLVIGVILLFILGVFPQILDSSTQALTAVFPSLAR